MFKLLSEIDNVQQTLKHAGYSDAGATDVVNKANAQDDVAFKNMRKTINNSGEVTGAFVADFINQAEDLNDEVDTIAFGVETDDGHIIKVYVAAEQADEFESALSTALGLDTDVETVLNDLANNFDIVDVVWPEGEGPDNDDDVPADGLDAEIASALDKDGDDEPFTDDDDYEVVSALPPPKDDLDDADPLDADNTLDADDLPVPDDNGEEETTPWMELNDLAINKFEDKEITSAADLDYDQLSKVIDIEKADEIAIKQYDAADFASLDADEKEDIINANPELIKKTKDDKEGKDDEAVVKPEDLESEEDKEITKESRSFSLLSSLL